MKKLLTLEQLVKFCKENKVSNFSAKETGYELAVQVPAELSFDEDSTRGMLFVKIKVCHTLLNRNGSYISEENMKKAMPSLKYRPVLGFIHQLDDGTYDFHSHDMEINDDNDIEYIESQIGTFTADEPTLEYDEDQDKTYVIAYAAIPEEYTKAADIIREKDGTKVSCELVIDSLSYNAKEKYLEIEDFYFQGCTCLGREKDGREIGEGMLGSRLDIEDFSIAKNSNFDKNYVAQTSQELIDALERLNIALQSFNINENSMKGGNQDVEKKDFEKDLPTEEEIEEGALTPEVENFEGEGDGEGDGDVAAAVDEGDSATTEPDSEEKEDEPVDGDPEGEEVVSVIDDSDDEEYKKKKYSIIVDDKEYTFEVSLNDKISALSDLVNATYSQEDNCYYSVQVFEEYLVMFDYWCGSGYYKQSYKEDGDSFSLVGDREEVFVNYLTKEEEEELNEIRANYASVVEELSAYKESEENASKDAIFEDISYAEYLEEEEFKSLMEEKEKYSIEELKDKAEIAFAKCVKRKGEFVVANNKEAKPSRHPFISAKKEKKQNPYGTILVEKGN